jgi:cation diffusion facilitator CzcD-associated flavoprotein CzcO
MTAEQPDCDVIVVGAGFAGLYAIYHLRALGFSVKAFERGSGVGGTWYWNRYPGARCDTPSLEYSYGFSPELEQEWEWTEYFASQPEIERYLNHVADRFELRAHLDFGVEVTGAAFDEGRSLWQVETSDGRALRAPFLVLATGCLSTPFEPDIDGLGRFKGTVVRTSNWPSGISLEGRRIGLVGTGSSGVQAAPELAKVAEHLFVFQRTPAFTWPSHNAPMDPEVQRAAKARYQELRRIQRTLPNGIAGFGGAPMFQQPRDVKILEATKDDLDSALEEFGWGACRAWSDVLRDPRANEIAVELYRTMIRRTIHDPDTAEALFPRGLPLGCKRPVLDVGYFESFNQPHVTVVDLRHDPIIEVTDGGIRTARTDYRFDVLVLATGFDAMTGALTRIDPTGRDGRRLSEAWAEGPRTLFGLQIAGYPNMFTITGPGSPSVVANMATGIEHHVEWIGRTMAYLRDNGFRTIEPTTAAQDAWVDTVNETAEHTMYTSPSCNSWYLGSNVPGKQRAFMIFVGGLNVYIAECERSAEHGYEGFRVA